MALEKGICGKHSCGSLFSIDTDLAARWQNCPHCGSGNLKWKARQRYEEYRAKVDGPMGPILPTPDPIMDQPPAQPVPATTYPDGNPKSAQGAKKFSLRLLPLPAEVEVNRALDDGRTKYGAANWRETGVAATVYVDAAKRHLAQWFDGGQENAADSGVHNLGHAMACLAILIDAQWNGKLIDDRPAPCRDTDLLLLRSKP